MDSVACVAFTPVNETCASGTCVACGNVGQQCCSGSCTVGNVCKSGICALDCVQNQPCGIDDPCKIFRLDCTGGSRECKQINKDGAACGQMTTTCSADTLHLPQSCGGGACRANDQPCGAGKTCSNNQCRGTTSDGQLCTSARADLCQSGNCVDGVCCKSPSCPSQSVCSTGGQCLKKGGEPCNTPNDCLSGRAEGTCVGDEFFPCKEATKESDCAPLVVSIGVQPECEYNVVCRCL